jgi:ribonuclease BN (tRNA processing enzyme)
MRLTVLGSGGGWARRDGAASGYLLQEEGFNLWLEAGTGTMANLQRHVDLLDVHAVIVSHQHFDHFLDLYPYFLARQYGRTETPPPVPLYAPPGMFEHARSLEPDLGQAFDVTEVTPGEEFEVGPFTVRTAPMVHPVPTLGMRFETDGVAFAYSADTAPTERLDGVARAADVLLAEATWLEPRPQAGPMHMTASEAGERAAVAGAGRLVLTHVWPSLDLTEMVHRAQAAFDGPVEAAVEGMRVDL